MTMMSSKVAVSQTVRHFMIVCFSHGKQRVYVVNAPTIFMRLPATFLGLKFSCSKLSIHVGGQLILMRNLKGFFRAFFFPPVGAWR